MRALRLTALLICALASGSVATSHAAPALDAQVYTSYDTEILTVDDTAGGVRFDLAKIRPVGKGFQAEKAQVTVECPSTDLCDFRFWTNGRAPTATEGHRVGNGWKFIVEPAIEVWRFRAIRVDAESATLMVTYYKAGQ